MKFKILIDKSTIKENQAVGSTELLESLPKTTNFTISGHSKEEGRLKPLKSFNCTIQEDSNHNFIANIVALNDGGAYIANDWIKRNKDIIENVSIETKANLVKHQTMPQPRYSFEYEPTFVECGSCGAKFKHIYLGEVYDEDGYIYSNVCPICDEYQCCEIEYQDIEEAVKENV